MTIGATRPILIPLRGIGSALALHVRHVLGMGSQKQVIGVDAQPVVTVMAYAHPRGDRADLKLIGDAVREGSAEGAVESAVPARISPADPQPALAALIDLRPEADSNVLTSGSTSTSVRAILTVLRRVSHKSLPTYRAKAAVARLARFAPARVGCYSHGVNHSLLVVGRPGDVSASPGLSVASIIPRIGATQ
jgi:hypothetical protein